MQVKGDGNCFIYSVLQMPICPIQAVRDCKVELLSYAEDKDIPLSAESRLRYRL